MAPVSSCDSGGVVLVDRTFEAFCVLGDLNFDFAGTESSEATFFSLLTAARVRPLDALTGASLTTFSSEAFAFLVDLVDFSGVFFEEISFCF